MEASTCTLVPGFQYFAGRQCTAVSFSSQPHAPWVSGLVRTRSVRSTAALSTTFSLKVRLIGIAMPYIPPPPTLAWADTSWAGATVVKEPVIG